MSLGLLDFYAWSIKKIRQYPRLKTVAQRFRYLLMRGPFQRFFVFYFRKRAKLLRDNVPSVKSIFPPFDIEKAVTEINRQSYSPCLQLPIEAINDLLAFQKSEQSDNIFHPHRKCTLVSNIACDSQIISIVRGYFRTEPIFYGSRLYYTKPRIGEDGEIPSKYAGAKLVHFDVTDFMDVTVFFYLHNVDRETSPHIVLPGTHKRKTFRELLTGRYTEDEARKKFGDNFVFLTGTAGFGFIEDTSAFHIHSPGKKGRATLALCYTMQRNAKLSQH